MHRDRLIVALALGATLLSTAAHAGNQDLYGLGARGPGLAGASVAFPRGYEALWYNPAGLIVGGERAFSFGIQSTSFDLEIYSPRAADLEHLAREDPISGVNLGVAVRLPLLGPLADRIAIGLALYVPTDTLLSAQIPLPFTPQFSLVGDRARSVSISAGLAVRATDWLEIGAGLRALAGLGGQIAVAPNELGRLGADVEDELVARFTPVIGVTARPDPSWSIGAVFRGELGGRFSIPITADLGDDLPLDVPTLNIRGMAVYDPAQAVLHLGWRPTDAMTVEAGVTWRVWSRYPLPIENTTIAVPDQPALDFHDTWAPRVGIEHDWVLGAWTLHGRGGYAFEPTPVPDQTGRHTFLDSDRHVAALGFGAEWGASESNFRVRVDLYGQLHLMQRRYAVKTLQTGEAIGVSGDDGVPWVGHEGRIFSFGGVVEVQL